MNEKSFYKLTYKQRIEYLTQKLNLSDQQVELIIGANDLISDQLIENFLLNYDLPEGIMTNLKVNNKSYMIPMVTEEPSVIAAASYGAKMLANQTGIIAEVLDNELTGQIIIETHDLEQLNAYITTKQAHLIEIANQSHPTILKYGGGAKNISVRVLDHNLVSLDVNVDTAEAMGANIMNTMLEAMANELSSQITGQIIMSILSNYADKKLVKVTGKVEFDQLSKHGDGQKVAQLIEKASYISTIDYKRATTNNKGIMNGIDAAAIALGNDWRAIESSVHAFAAKDGHYVGLSQWRVVEQQLVGQMILPMPVGFVGGATKVLPKAQLNKDIAKIENVREEMQVLAAVGLAQNLAALRALVSEGIQKGHMNLQFKSLAMANGAKTSEVDMVIKALRKIDHPSSDDVIEILKDIRK